MTFALPQSTAPEIHCSPAAGAPLDLWTGGFELYQDSSGGENWRSSTHVTHDGRRAVVVSRLPHPRRVGHRRGVPGDTGGHARRRIAAPVADDATVLAELCQGD